MSNQTEKIWAVSMAPRSLQTPVHVNRKVKDTDAWRIHQMKEIGDPALEPVPLRSAMGAPTKQERAKMIELQKERDELQAKFDAMAAELEAVKKGAKEVNKKQPA